MKALALAIIAAFCAVSLHAQAKTGLAFKDLQSFTYDLGETASVEGGKVPLANGTWKDPADGGSTFTLLPIHALGDFNGDGAIDAAAVLLEGTSGTGGFNYLFGLINENGKPVQLGPPEWLGDRSVIERLSIDRQGILTVRYITHKDRDPACCPTLRIEDRYRVENGKLVGITK